MGKALYAPEGIWVPVLRLEHYFCPQLIHYPGLAGYAELFREV